MFHVPEEHRRRDGVLKSGEEAGNNGCFMIPSPWGADVFKIIASDGHGWEHVSVSMPKKIPTWTEMCWIKAQFWDEDDCVIQYHPAKKDYVNHHPRVLHMWRPIDRNIPTPPHILVGPK